MEEKLNIIKEEFIEDPIVTSFLKVLINKHYKKLPNWVIRDKFEEYMIPRLADLLYYSLIVDIPDILHTNKDCKYTTSPFFNCDLNLVLFSDSYDPTVGPKFDEFCDPNKQIVIPREIINLLKELHKEDYGEDYDGGDYEDDEDDEDYEDYEDEDD